MLFLGSNQLLSVGQSYKFILNLLLRKVKHSAYKLSWFYHNIKWSFQLIRWGESTSLKQTAISEWIE